MSEAERIIRALLLALTLGTVTYLVSEGMHAERVWPGVVLTFCAAAIITLGLTRGQSR